MQTAAPRKTTRRKTQPRKTTGTPASGLLVVLVAGPVVGVVVVAEAPQIRNEAVRISLATVITLWLGSRLAGVLWWLVSKPVLWVAAITGYGVWRLYDGTGTWAVAAAGAVLVTGMVGWRLGHPASFRPMVSWPVRAWWRRVFVYSREWEALMATLKLAAKSSGDELLVPDLQRVRCTGTVDKVRLRMLPGQVLADYAKVADRFAATFEALDCRVRSVHRPQPLRMGVFRINRALGRMVRPRRRVRRGCSSCGSWSTTRSPP